MNTLLKLFKLIGLVNLLHLFYSWPLCTPGRPERLQIMQTLGAVLFVFMTAFPSYGAILEYFGGGFAVTPYSYVQVNNTEGQPIAPPIESTYNPGTFYGTQSLSGSNSISVQAPIGYPFYSKAEVSWNAQTSYGNSFNLTMQSHTNAGNGMWSGWANSSIRLNTLPEGFFLKLTPEAGEQIGQAAKLFWDYNFCSICGYYGNYPFTKLESGDSQPVAIMINGNPVWSMPTLTVPWDNEPFYLYRGSDELYKDMPDEDGGLWRDYISPIECKIGDIIGLYFGDYLSSNGYQSGMFMSNGIGDTEITLSLTPEVDQISFTPVPLPGAFFLLGAGLGCLVLYSRRK